MFTKMIGFLKDEDGATAAHNERRQVKQVLKEEWRAIRITQQDRAYLATVAHAPSAQRILFEPAGDLYLS
jgi:hypothetical protein